MKYCMQCGEKLNDDQAFCTNCGAPVSAPVQRKSQYRDEPASEVPETAPKKNKALMWGLIAGGSVLLIGLVFLILWLTGVFNKPASEKDEDFGNRVSEAVVEKMSPSAEKLIAAENNFVFGTFSKIKQCVTALRKTAFDASITADVSSTYGSDGFALPDLINRANIILRMDGRTGYDFEADLSIAGNPFVDVKLFDLNQSKVSLYCSTDPGYLYVASLDQMLPRLLSSGRSGVPVEAILQLLYKDNLGSLLESDFLDLGSALTAVIRDDNTEVVSNTEETIQDIGAVPCEKYTVIPTQEDLETFLGKVYDTCAKSDSFVSKVLTLSGQSFRDLVGDRESFARNNAEYLVRHGLKLEVAIQKGSIISQRIFFDESVILSYVSYRSESGYYSKLESPVFWIKRNDVNGRTKISGYIEGYNIDADLDLSQKSVIGTYVGRFAVSDRYHGTLAVIDVQPSSDGMMHVITLNPDALGFSSTFSRFVLNINVKPGSGVARPNPKDVTEEDITNYDTDQLQDLLNRLVGPLMYSLNTMNY